MSATIDREQAMTLVYAAVDQLNRQLRKNQRLDKSPTTPLAGAGGGVDSLGVLNLLVVAEERIAKAYGVEIVLADADALAMEPSPFRTLGSLAEHIQAVVERRRDRP
jgi:acyl carrier protein